MEYLFIEQDPEARGYNQFCHEISFHLNPSREMELFEFLEEAIGKRGRVWRLRGKNSFNLFSRTPSTIRFIKKSDAMRFKLSWEEDPSPESELEKWMRKLNANSLFGGVRRGAVTAVAPTWNVGPITPLSAGILPGSGKTHVAMQQIKSRLQSQSRPSNRYRLDNLCDDVILLDYESSPLKWYDEWIKGRDIRTWSDYEMFLDASIRDEDKQREAKVGQDEAALQAGLFLSYQEEPTAGTS